MLIDEIINKCVNYYFKKNLFEEKQKQTLSWFLKNVDNGKYDPMIYHRMHSRNYKYLMSQYVGKFPVSEDGKQILYDYMLKRYETILTCISNTSQICSSILTGMFDEDIANNDYSWFDNIDGDIDKYYIQYFMDKRVQAGKKRGLFRNLSKNKEWCYGKNNSNIELKFLLLPEDLVKQ